jgi:outer membrane protein
MIIRTITIIGWFLICFFSVSAYALTEQDAIYQALKNNVDITVAKLQLESDSLGLEQAKAGRLPVLDLTASTKYAPLSKTTTYGVSTDDSKDLSSSVGANLTQALPGGATIAANVGQDALLRKLNADSANHNTSFGVTVTQPLLKGAWDAAPLDYALAVARLNHDQFTLSQKKQILSTLSGIRTFYWSYYEKKELLKIAANAMDYSQKQLIFAKARFQVGQATELDTLSAALELSKAQQNQLSAATAEHLARLNLATALKTDTNAIALPDTINLSVADFPAPENFIAMVREYDPSLKIFAVAGDKLKQDERKKKTELWPALSVSAGYTYSMNGDTLFSDNTASSKSAVVSLVMNYSLPTTQNRLDLQKNRLDQEQNQLSREKYQRDLEQRVAELSLNWQQDKMQLDIMARSRDIAQRQLMAAQKGYQIGTVGRLELLKAENDYTQIALSYVQAQVALKKLEIIFDEMNGQILKKFGVNL